MPSSNWAGFEGVGDSIRGSVVLLVAALIGRSSLRGANRWFLDLVSSIVARLFCIGLIGALSVATPSASLMASS
jgi:hypothetical protein